jgi:hypothetical protein
MDTTGNKIVLVVAPDWQVLYVNGKMEIQDYRIEFRHAMPVLLKNNWNYGMQLEIREVDYKWTENVPDEITDKNFTQK